MYLWPGARKHGKMQLKKGFTAVTTSADINQRRNQCTKISRSGRKKGKLHVVRQQERLHKKKTKFPLQVVENQGKAQKKKKRMQLFYCRYWGTRPAEWWIVLQGTEELDLQKIFAQWILCRKWKSGRITGKWGFNPWAIISWFVYAGNWRLRQGVEDSTLDPNLHVYLWGR